MLRVPRLDSPGLLHHVMIRGIEHRKIVDNMEREGIVDLLIGHEVSR